MDLDFEDIYDIADDVLLVAGIIIAIFTAYRIEGIALALVGIGIMYSKGEFSGGDKEGDKPDPCAKSGAEDSSGEEDETEDEDAEDSDEDA